MNLRSLTLDFFSNTKFKQIHDQSEDVLLG